MPKISRRIGTDIEKPNASSSSWWELNEAVRLDVTLGYAHLFLARLYLLRGDYARAEASARQAIQVQETGSSLRGSNVAGARLVLGGRPSSGPPG